MCGFIIILFVFILCLIRILRTKNIYINRIVTHKLKQTLCWVEKENKQACYGIVGSFRKTTVKLIFLFIYFVKNKCQVIFYKSYYINVVRNIIDDFYFNSISVCSFLCDPIAHQFIFY